MICALLSALLALTPITNPLACGPESEFRLIHGLVPGQDWASVPGMPFSNKGTFSEITYHNGSSRSFRALSSGPTAGLNFAIGSYVNSEGYAGFLDIQDFQVKVCEFKSGLNAGASFRGASVEARDAGSDDPAFFAGYSSEHVLLAAGETVFTGGFFLNLAENVSLGPAWCQDRELARFWMATQMEFGPLRFHSGGAVTDSSFRRRADATLDCGVAEITAGIDEEEFFMITETQLGAAELSVCVPHWGFHLLLKPGDNYLVSLSHKEGGELSGELQFSFNGFVTGLTCNRETGGKWTSGFLAGLAFPSAESPDPSPR